MSNIEKNSKKVYCICDKGFTKSWNLTRHQKTCSLYQRKVTKKENEEEAIQLNVQSDQVGQYEDLNSDQLRKLLISRDQEIAGLREEIVELNRIKQNMVTAMTKSMMEFRPFMRGRFSSVNIQWNAFDWKEKTMQQAKSLWNKFLSYCESKKPSLRLNGTSARMYLITMKETLRNSTMQKQRKQLRTILKQLDPLTQIDRVTGLPGKKTKFCPSNGDILELLKFLDEKDKMIFEAVAFMATYGVRFNVMYNLKWKHIDADHDRVQLPDTKTAQEDRDLPEGLKGMLDIMAGMYISEMSKEQYVFFDSKVRSRASTLKKLNNMLCEFFKGKYGGSSYGSHMFRRLIAQVAYNREQKIAIEAAGHALGHSSKTSTECYVKKSHFMIDFMTLFYKEYYGGSLGSRPTFGQMVGETSNNVSGEVELKRKRGRPKKVFLEPEY